MVEVETFKQLLSIELKKEIKSLKQLSNDEQLYAKFLYRAIKDYEHRKPGEKPVMITKRAKDLFFSLSCQIRFLLSLYPFIKAHCGRVLISEIITSKFNKRKELFE